jgi:hypothetical protein
MSIVLVGSTSGSVTLQEPAVAGTTVLTLPATSGTVLTTGSSGQSIPKAALPTGSVLQVVQYVYSSSSSTSSSTYVSTSLATSITPNFSTSKILVMVSCGTTYQSTSATAAYTIYRGASDLAPTARGFALSSSTGNLPVTFSYLDSPSTTSSTTYTVYMRTNGGTTYLGGSDGGVMTSNTITLLEIAA